MGQVRVGSGAANLLSEPRAGGEQGDKQKRAQDGDVDPCFARRKRKTVVCEPYSLLTAVVGVAAIRPQAFCHKTGLHFRAAPVATSEAGALACLKRVLLPVGQGFDVDEEQHCGSCDEIVTVESDIGPGGNGGHGDDPQ